MDAVYCRVSTETQTAENQFEDLFEIAERDGSARDWDEIRRLTAICVVKEVVMKNGVQDRIFYHINQGLADSLAEHYHIYIEQGKSGKAGAPRPMFERLKHDAALRRFDRLLVWKVSRLGRSMRELISSVYELADLKITTVPIKDQTGPIDSTMGKLLWSIQAWSAEMENQQRSEAIKAGIARVKRQGGRIGRKPVVVDMDSLKKLRDANHSIREIAKVLGISRTVVHKHVKMLEN
jgi:DNA invertase Pin-like site-specific DNA recombinase